MTAMEESRKRLLGLVRALHAGASPAGRDRLPPPALVRHHRLAPLCFRAGLAEYRDDYAASALVAARRERRLAEAIAALTAAAVPVALLKGVSYAPTLYPDVAERPMTDIDLLVPPDQHPAALAALTGIGYRLGTRLGHHHAVMMVRGDDPIDVHRAILSARTCRIDLGAVWRRAAPATERSDGARRLDPVDELLFHFAGLTRTALVAPLISYLDGARMLARLSRPDRLALPRRASAYRVARVVEVGLSTVGALLDDRPRTARWPAPRLAELLAEHQLAPNRRRIRTLALADGPREVAGWLVHWTLERAERHRLRR